MHQFSPAFWLLVGWSVGLWRGLCCVVGRSVARLVLLGRSVGRSAARLVLLGLSVDRSVGGSAWSVGRSVGGAAGAAWSVGRPLAPGLLPVGTPGLLCVRQLINQSVGKGHQLAVGKKRLAPRRAARFRCRHRQNRLADARSMHMSEKPLALPWRPLGSSTGTTFLPLSEPKQAWHRQPRG